MNQYTYDFEIQTMMTMFVNAMSDIVVKRFNVHKAPENQIKVRIVYAPKQRVINDLLNRDQNLVLPVMACYIGGIARDPNRTFNKIVGSYNELPDGKYLNEKQPLPINVAINVSVMTRYQADMDQIISHLIPYINPYFVVSWRTPSRPDFEIRSSVYWDGNVAIQYPMDLQSNQVARVIADLSFSFKGWLFQALPTDTIGSIFTINSTYAPTIELDYNESYTSFKLRNTTDADTFTYDGLPPQPKVVDPYTVLVGERKEFNIYGAGFKNLQNVYLSGIPFAYSSTIQDPFSAISTLSANNPSFSATKLSKTEWITDNEQFMSFVMPSAQSIGYVDVILEGPYGYSSLTKNVRVATLNPYQNFPNLSSIDYTPYQLPFLSGIQVFQPYVEQ